MRLFSTEFPVRRISDRAEFVAQVVGWLKGTKYSFVLDSDSLIDLDRDYSILRYMETEELIFREITDGSSFKAIGFRYDYKDADGRLWRTEAVLSRNLDECKDDLIRLRTQCLSLRPDARLELPKKPFLIKSILGDGLGGRDGSLNVTDRPIWLHEDEQSLEVANNVVYGSASKYLPIVYISCVGEHRWIFSSSQIEKLAYDLGGVAHVLVEPTVDFSFKHKDATKGCNVYGGTVGLFVPGRGFLCKFYIGWEYPDLVDLGRAISSSATRARSYLPAVGWDWTELQEKALTGQRERERHRLSFEDKETLYNDEISILKERNRELQDKISVLEHDISEGIRMFRGGDGAISSILASMLGPEIYDGEFADRLRLCACLAQDSAEKVGLDDRSVAFIRELLTVIRPSGALARFRSELDAATNDARRMAGEVSALMRRHGFQTKSENKHVKLEPLPGYWGLSPITMAKTPSDSRGLKNQRSQIEKALGIVALK